MALSEKREVTCLYVSNPTEREITIENVQFVGSDGVIDIRPDKNLASVGSHKSGQIIIREVWTDGYFVVKDALGNRFKSNKV